MEQGICYIYGAGEYYGPTPRLERIDLIIAADGGYEHVMATGMKPDLVVGDMDSFPGTPEDIKNIVVLPQIKDETDMQASIRTGWGAGYRQFYIYGGTGGRLDHTLANIQSIADIARRGGRGWLSGSDTLITAIHKSSISFPPDSEGIVSVFAHDDTVSGVTETGLKYTLSNASLSNTKPTGVSNEFTGQRSEIKVTGGTLLVIYPKTVKAEYPS